MVTVSSKILSCKQRNMCSNQTTKKRGIEVHFQQKIETMQTHTQTHKNNNIETHGGVSRSKSVYNCIKLKLSP